MHSRRLHRNSRCRHGSAGASNGVALGFLRRQALARRGHPIALCRLPTHRASRAPGCRAHRPSRRTRLGSGGLPVLGRQWRHRGRRPRRPKGLWHPEPPATTPMASSGRLAWRDRLRCNRDLRSTQSNAQSQFDAFSFARRTRVGAKTCPIWNRPHHVCVRGLANPFMRFDSSLSLMPGSCLLCVVRG